MEFPEQAKRASILRRLYDWVLHWADTPYGSPALVLLSFSESSFFPIPPDVLLIALSLSLPKKAFFYATICSIASVLGGAFGYFLGFQFMELIGMPILSFYGYGAIEKFEQIQQLYRQYDAWAVGIAGFTPIPYKIFTIAAGAFQINFFTFTIASLISRSARFFLVSTLIYYFGEPVKGFIEKYFDILSILFVVFLILGFLVVKWFV